MKKIIILISVLFAGIISLSAQIIREQADSIVQMHLQEIIEHTLLYVHINGQSEEGITITTSNQEIFTAKYACWAYYVNESEYLQCRYIFVKEDNGNLLEIVTSNDIGQSDTTQWKAINDSTNIEEPTVLPKREIDNVKFLYPNPTNGQLRIMNYELQVEAIHIFDIMGKQLPLNLERTGSEVETNISHLPAGIYLLQIKTEKGIVTQKVIKY